jgi:hypothetical protein
VPYTVSILPITSRLTVQGRGTFGGVTFLVARYCRLTELHSHCPLVPSILPWCRGNVAWKSYIWYLATPRQRIRFRPLHSIILFVVTPSCQRASYAELLQGGKLNSQQTRSSTPQLLHLTPSLFPTSLSPPPNHSILQLLFHQPRDTEPPDLAPCCHAVTFCSFLKFGGSSFPLCLRASFSTAVPYRETTSNFLP